MDCKGTKNFDTIASWAKKYFFGSIGIGNYYFLNFAAKNFKN